MTVIEVLRLGRARIARGWAQGPFDIIAEKDKWCALTATSCDAGEAEWEADRLVAAVIDDDVPMWNDDPGRTKEDVLAVYDRAIALAEAEAAP